VDLSLIAFWWATFRFNQLNIFEFIWTLEIFYQS
jgi:hypothetical protein